MATNLREVFKGGARSASEEVRQRFAERAESFRKSTRILTPDDVAGDYDTGRLLATTLGGQIRPLTRDDLVTFQKNADALGKKYRGGVTAKTIIEHSLPEDRARANREIRVAVPVQSRGYDAHFVTNAGPNSDVTRHHVHVQFLNFDAAVSSPARAAETVSSIINGRMRVQCDCGRWNFWFSYLATIGKFNAGRPQTGYPRVRNPKLVGIACKHILRVAQQLNSPQVKQYVEKMVAHARRDIEPALKRVTKKDAEAMAQGQLGRAHFKRSQIETTVERRTRLAAQAEAKRVAQASKAKMPTTDKGKVTALRKAENTARLLAAQSGMSAKQLDALLETIRGQFK